jgi:hypothetical protein
MMPSADYIKRQNNNMQHRINALVGFRRRVADLDISERDAEVVWAALDTEIERFRSYQINREATKR